MSREDAAGAAGTEHAAGRPHPRPRHRTAWTVAAALSAVFVVAPGAWWAWSHHWAGESGTLSGTSADRPVTALEIDAGEAAVTVSPRADQRVVYRAAVRWSLGRPEIEESWLGGTLRLTPHCPGVDTALGAGLGCMIDLGVTVPAGIPVKVTGGSGKVDISGLGGAVDLRTDSGTLRLTALRGPLRAVVDSGSLEATALTSPEADIRSGTGSAVARFLTPPDRITARTGSGKVAVTVPVATRFQVTSRVGAGSLEVARGLADPAAPGRLDLSADSGRAEAGYP
ncbi:hypothetical protein OHS33_31985 [Streptomyces sp. NBC_00536]|uniref:hypothetical protein n=1 Tax=Streptomyces sp. NBC_00536 TaxID=2975769 RepID=UPI002E8218AE|nr:hypothetical protein [Streptomyces sp. NBC_00536]WUC82575.1 hypothetical protein OHS33_31985 [Streptomyces sp. NBC_00536]